MARETAKPSATDWSPNLQREHAFAIVRIDSLAFQDTDVESAVYVVKVVWSEAVAEAEVARLNELNKGKAHYFWQITRIDRRKSKQKIRPAMSVEQTP